MKRLTVVIVGCLMIGSFAINAQAGRIKCTVSAVKDNAVIVDCGEKSMDLKVGSTVTLKTVTKMKSVIEGC
jgi:hypothetical protein